ncbi:hypothetical protein PF005_g5442 [Phytophthora fragariae]|uniref:Secreted protein n=1 Tax=Phytophthora fragariae TaxID=53985 RepID=A0A6A3UI07_9STRA|nr:hypothetical protein PF003_g20960 [Phytophthora fragariae]KAE8948646.1 hypothetical protein PF009_g1767 [Phytophthora fragariae]KAE9127696.1 hypothetical protein PF007_g5531 [Phytophthora fragariae]KAE9128026.1 hypothetical protein PF010_g4668 [Phytophthora fragariae]KAE9151102.1 hypothetical protein PF006_g4583 [Phytophthora fragariae]
MIIVGLLVSCCRLPFMLVRPVEKQRSNNAEGTSRCSPRICISSILLKHFSSSTCSCRTVGATLPLPFSPCIISNLDTFFVFLRRGCSANQQPK